MNTKEVTDRERSGKLVVQAGATHAEAAARAIAERLKKHTRAGAEKLDVAALIHQFGLRLTANVEAMVAADEAHEVELGDDAQYRDARDAAHATLYKLVIDVRDQVKSVLGDPGLEKLGMKSPATDSPDRLAVYARSVVRKLADAKIELPAPKRKTATVDRGAMRDELEAALAPLEEALKDVSREVKEAEATRVARQKAIAEYDDAFAETANLYDALFRAAGMDEIADRVRPSKRRPGRTATDEGEGDAPAEPRAPS
jgi:hypothetical protein